MKTIEYPLANYDDSNENPIVETGEGKGRRVFFTLGEIGDVLGTVFGEWVLKSSTSVKVENGMYRNQQEFVRLNSLP